MYWMEEYICCLRRLEEMVTNRRWHWWLFPRATDLSELLKGSARLSTNSRQTTNAAGLTFNKPEFPTVIEEDQTQDLTERFKKFQRKLNS